jgi:hypothetical protein
MQFASEVLKVFWSISEATILRKVVIHSYVKILLIFFSLRLQEGVNTKYEVFTLISHEVKLCISRVSAEQLTPLLCTEWAPDSFAGSEAR